MPVVIKSRSFGSCSRTDRGNAVRSRMARIASKALEPMHEFRGIGDRRREAHDFDAPRQPFPVRHFAGNAMIIIEQRELHDVLSLRNSATAKALKRPPWLPPTERSDRHHGDGRTPNARASPLAVRGIRHGSAHAHRDSGCGNDSLRVG